uniref:Uncharacterized protein n=1 Tax=Rhizophora mucronata TaxID=61149 RepID=A0A2P2NFD7_RHIMU
MGTEAYSCDINLEHSSFHLHSPLRSNTANFNILQTNQNLEYIIYVY